MSAAIASVEPETLAEDDFEFPDPHEPSAPGWGAHVLGTIVGLILGPIGVVGLVLGQSRILEAQTDGWTSDIELLGIIAVPVAALVLAGLVILGAWTASAPMAGGVVIAGVGAYALIAPGYFSDFVISTINAPTWLPTIQSTVVATTSGTAITTGILVLAAGVAIAMTRRHGIRVGAFRERHQVPHP